MAPVTLLVLAALVASPLQAAPKRRAPTRPAISEPQKLVHVLDRLTFGARPGDLERLRRKGIERFIEEQLHPERIPDAKSDAALAAFPTLRMTSYQLQQAYPNAKAGMPVMKPPREIIDQLSAAKIERAVLSERQLQEIMVDFWFNHFNVYALKNQDKWLVTSYERDVIRPRALGRFRDLLGAVAHSPAMLVYLDNYQSTIDARYAPIGAREDISEMESRMAANGNGRRKLGLNENYARELMELHTLGVDGGYTQKDVTELARILTGWTLKRPNGNNGLTDFAFDFNRRMHDPGGKALLGHPFMWEGEPEGEKALDLLARHPSTAHFIALKLCRRFVADDPPKALVDRVARRFIRSDGDIRETLREIFRSPEFWDPKTFRAKVKTPFEFVVSALRATGAEVRDPVKIARHLERMGEPLYLCEPPTGYPDRADAWISSGALLQRMQLVQVLFNRNPNAPVSADPTESARGIGAGDRLRLVQAMIRDYLAGQISEKTRSAILERIDRPGINPRQIAALVLGSPDFQRR